MAKLAEPTTPEETLAVEAATRGRTAVIAWIAGICTLGGAIISGIAFVVVNAGSDAIIAALNPRLRTSRRGR